MKLWKPLLTSVVLAMTGCGSAPAPQGPLMSKEEMKGMATTHAQQAKSASEPKKSQQSRQHSSHLGK